MRMKASSSRFSMEGPSSSDAGSLDFVLALVCHPCLFCDPLPRCGRLADRIITARVQRVTAEQAFHTQPNTPQRPRSVSTACRMYSEQVGSNRQADGSQGEIHLL